MNFTQKLALFLASLSVLPAWADVVHDPAPPVQLGLGHTAPLSTLALSDDGQTIVSFDTTLQLRGRDAGTGKTLFTTTIPEATSQAVLAPDGSLLMVGDNGVIHWFEPPATSY